MKILEKLKEGRIFEIRPVYDYSEECNSIEKYKYCENGVSFVEMCDECFGVDLTKRELVALANELLEIAQMMPSDIIGHEY